MFKIANKVVSAIKEKEYTSEYLKFCSIANVNLIKGKEIIIIYDDVLPDMYVNIIVDNKFIKAINYDIYARRLKSVKLEFPNGDTEIFDITSVREEYEKDGVCTLTWEVPMVSFTFHDMNIEISMHELMEQGIKVYIEDYSFEFEGYESEEE